MSHFVPQHSGAERPETPNLGKEVGQGHLSPSAFWNIFDENEMNRFSDLQCKSDRMRTPFNGQDQITARITSGEGKPSIISDTRLGEEGRMLFLLSAGGTWTWSWISSYFFTLKINLSEVGRMLLTNWEIVFVSCVRRCRVCLESVSSCYCCSCTPLPRCCSAGVFFSSFVFPFSFSFFFFSAPLPSAFGSQPWLRASFSNLLGSQSGGPYRSIKSEMNRCSLTS